jgi:DNA-directed RNA polymerase specialized sigma24 family protein
VESCKANRTKALRILGNTTGDSPFSDASFGPTVLIQRSETDLVRHAMEQLPVHFRETLLLCDVEEMSYQEIAEVLSIPNRYRDVTIMENQEGGS